jgi:UDP-N-acetylmuramate dehydrogenase
MVVDPSDPDSVSAGSFFTNPILDAAAFAELARRAGEAPPRFAAEGEGVKTSAAWLIERAGFHRGDVRGNVGISAKHSLALVNRGGATTAELVAFAREIAAGVRERFGVELAPEPIFVGHSFD